MGKAFCLLYYSVQNTQGQQRGHNSSRIIISILNYFCNHAAAAAAVTSVVSDSVRPHRQQPTRLPCPWDTPGKNTGVGCHFLLQCMKVKSESEVAQSCPTLHDPMDCSLPGSSIHGIFQARVLEWVHSLALLVIVTNSTFPLKKKKCSSLVSI